MAKNGGRNKSARKSDLVDLFDRLQSTREIPIPKDPLDMLIGQDEAVSIAKIAAKQRRHLLLVGPPGVGKSMLAMSLVVHIEPPKEEIAILHNPRNPERPIVEVRHPEDMDNEETIKKAAMGKLRKPEELPDSVAERMGFKCTNCGQISDSDIEICSNCNEYKYGTERFNSPFSDLVSQVFNVGLHDQPEEEVHLRKVDESGNEEIIIYQNLGEGRIRVIDKETFENISKLEKRKKSKIIVSLKRNPFVQATGASETELLGDVKHDPWGGMVEAGGLAPYQRIIPGAIHEAHEGVLYVDEIPQLGKLQSHILTAMQEKVFPIIGRNPTSSGASVRVDRVPCDFIFVGACNVNQLEHILPPLRSRISGSGYEVLLESTMPATEENKAKIAQFFAQEVALDGRIPHGDKEAIIQLIKEAENRAFEIDGKKAALTLRLRGLGGVIRLAGDLAKMEEADLITKSYIKQALKRTKSVEEQMVKRYGSMWKGKAIDNAQRRIISEEGNARGYL